MSGVWRVLAGENCGLVGEGMGLDTELVDLIKGLEHLPRLVAFGALWAEKTLCELYHVIVEVSRLVPLALSGQSPCGAFELEGELRRTVCRPVFLIS